jgi:uncharacterized protein (DUF1800 family)
MAHLYRRAGFGASRDELEAAVVRGYEATVEELLHPEQQPDLDLDLIYRFYPDVKEEREIEITQAYWVYRMINSPRQLEEKMALFWHSLFATAFNKSNHAQMVHRQVNMFRRHCLGSFTTLLVELSRDPAMIFWLDNQENTRDVHNENYGRELLELFSMGIGNYTEDDVKECARAFTGWGIKNLLNAGPYGRNVWEYQFFPEQHDYGEKQFLGHQGRFDGADIVDIVVAHPATARFIAKRLYLFFVSDKPDDAAIEELAQVFEETNGDIRAVMRVLLLSDAFCSTKNYFAKVKSPAEHVVGVAKLVGDFRYPSFGIVNLAYECRYMGQDLMNPPSVEGWHTGKEWIDTGILVERVNFASEQVGDLTKPGVRALVDRLRAMGPLEPEALVEACLDLAGPVSVQSGTRQALVNQVRSGGVLELASDPAAERRVTSLLQLIVATREYQFA